MNKFFFLHIPKTAGTFFNRFLSNQCNSFVDHIEIKNLSKDELDAFDGFSGHIPYPRAKKEYILSKRKIITILRNPIEQVISHITFIRELAEPSEKERLYSHSKGIQEIALKLKETNLSNSDDIKKFIKWLEDKNYLIFHDCQTRYLGGGAGEIKPAILNNALKNLKEIEYVGLTERLKEFMIYLNLKEKYKLVEFKKENVTKNRYGLDITNPKLVEALQPLVQNDYIVYVYNFAREKFVKGYHNALVDRELKKGLRYTTVRLEILYDELRREDDEVFYGQNGK